MTIPCFWKVYWAAFLLHFFLSTTWPPNWMKDAPRHASWNCLREYPFYAQIWGALLFFPPLLWQLGWWFLPINSPDLLLQFTPYIMLSHGCRWQFDTAACAQTWLLRSDADLLFVQGIELSLFTAGGCSECPSKHPDLLFRAATEPITSIRYLSLVQRDERGPKMINKASNALSMPDFSSNHPY